jgi:hypothetical protein
MTLATTMETALESMAEEQEPKSQSEGKSGILKRQLHGLTKHNLSLQSRIKFQLQEIEESDLSPRQKGFLIRGTLRSFIDLASGERQPEDREEQRCRPTLEELKISTHRSCKCGSGPVNCDGQMEILEVFGSTVEHQPGCSAGPRCGCPSYDYAFVALQCSDPDCKYPDFAMANPRRKARKKAAEEPEGPQFKRQKRNRKDLD